MEPLIIIYISVISMLGLFASTKVCNCNNETLDKHMDTNKKEHIHKKSFKHYHSH